MSYKPQAAKRHIHLHEQTQILNVDQGQLKHTAKRILPASMGWFDPRRSYSLLEFLEVHREHACPREAETFPKATRLRGVRCIE
jgi:hypothetical protein